MFSYITLFFFLVCLFFVQAGYASDEHKNSDIKIYPVYAYVLNNSGEKMMSIKSDIEIQRQDVNQWRTVLTGNIFDQSDNMKKLDCYNLSPNSDLTIGPWFGSSCLTTSCDHNVPLPDGLYRFVVMTCDGSKKIITPTFRKVYDYSK